MDPHDMGLRYVAEVLRESGAEVIFIRYRLVEEVIPVALQEGVDVIGLSFYSTGAIEDTAIVLKALKEQHMEDIPLVLGGIFSDEDASLLREMGVKEVIGPGRPIAEVINCITSL